MLVTICVWLSFSWDLRLSADKLADHKQQVTESKGGKHSTVVGKIAFGKWPEQAEML